MSPYFINWNNTVKKFCTLILLAWQQYLANFSAWNSNPCGQHVKNSSCTNFLILQNINNISHTFLWRAKPGSKVSLSNPQVTHQSFFVWNFSIAILDYPLCSWSHKSVFFNSLSLLFFFLAQQPSFRSHFQLESLFSNQKFNYGMLLKMQWLAAGISWIIAISHPLKWRDAKEHVRVFSMSVLPSIGDF